MLTPSDRLNRVRAGIAKAANVAGRDPATVRLVAVSKGRSADEIESLLDSGQRDFGESRVQEALEKWPALLDRYPDTRLHSIGRLQSNKAADSIRLFDTFHALDRASLLDTLTLEATQAGRAPKVYIQVNIGEEPQKGGCAIGEVGALIKAVRASPLPLTGLMCIPPAAFEPGPYFALLAKLAGRHDVAGLSMGMSGDYQTAVMLGATSVRVGTALFED